MGGGVDFWYNLDCVELSGCDNPLHVAEAVGFLVAVLSALCEFWVGGEFDREGFVIDEVPVEDIEFGEGHGGDEFDDAVDAQEVAGGVDHDASVRDHWLIVYVDIGDLSVFDDLGEGLEGVDVAGVVAESDVDSLFVDG